MLDEPEYARWRADAGQALEAARTQSGAGQHNWSCFLSEQAAQLTIKALLQGVGAGSKGHDLVDLGQRCTELFEGDWPEQLSPALTRLSRLYIPTRCADMFAAGSAAVHYGSEDSAEALTDAKLVVQAIDDLWQRLLLLGASV